MATTAHHMSRVGRLTAFALVALMACGIPLSAFAAVARPFQPGTHQAAGSRIRAAAVPTIRFAGPESRPNAQKCPNGQWIGFAHGNTDITGFYDGNTGTGPNGCEVSDNPVTIPDATAGVPAAVTVPSTAPVQLMGSNTVTVASGGTLAVPAGATLLMEGDSSMFVQSGGTLNLSGTGTSAAQTVTVKSPTESPGNWGMIDFQKGSAGAVAYAVIDDGGSPATDGNGDTLYTEIGVEGAGIPITHSQLDNSYGNGIEITQVGNPTLTDDTFTYSTTPGFSTSSGYAIQYDVVPGDLTNSVSGLSSTGYGYNDMEIGPNGGAAGSFTGTGSWPRTGMPYRIGVDVNIADKASLTIPAGVTLLMSSASVFVQSGGTLNVSGAAGSPVTFTSANDFAGSTHSDNPGDWGTVDFQDGSAGSVTYAIVKDGGSPATGSANTLYTDLAVEGVRSTVAVTNSKFVNSYGNGIELTDKAKVTLTNDSFTYCSTCSFSNSSGFAVHFDFDPSNLISGTGSAATPLLSGLTSTGYGYNDVYICGSNNSCGLDSGTGTWPNAGLPYWLDGDVHVTAGAKLTLAAGDSFLMNGNLYADNNGALVIAGTPAAPVTFTSTHDFPLSNTAPSPGDWGGIDYENGSTGSMAYATVKYGGGSTADGSGDLVIGTVKSGFKVVDSTFLHSYSNDVDVVNGGLPHLNRDTFGPVAGGNFGVNNSGYTSGPKVDATLDYWSSTGGPAGTTARASTGVTDKPWYSNTSTGATTASVLKAFGASGSIGVQGAGGTGGVGVDTLNADPKTATPSGVALVYFDARVWSGSTYTSVVLKECEKKAGQSLVFFNSSAWHKLTGVSGPDSNGCLSATLTAGTTPKLSALAGNGVMFAAVAPVVLTKTSLSSNAAKNASTYGRPVKLTAGVTATSGTPKGSVAFTSGKTKLGKAKLSGGKASLTVKNLTPGKDAVVAVYTPAAGSGFQGSTAKSLTITVKPAAVLLTYTGGTSIAPKKSVTLSAVLKSASARAPISGRKLTIALGTGKSAQTCTTGTTNNKGAASCALKKVTLGKGKTSVKVSFAGDKAGLHDFYAAGSITKPVTIT